MKQFFVAFIFLYTSTLLGQTSGTSWQSVLDKKNGEIVVYWYPSNTLTGKSKDGIDGVEHDLMLSFVNYLQKKHSVSLNVRWIQPGSFNEVLDAVSSGKNGTFGASSISITHERKEILKFTPPFFPDISVLISHPRFPIAKTTEDFSAIFRNALAVTIPNTTLEKELLLLKDGRKLNCDFTYVVNGGEIIEKVTTTPNAFGYVDLPNFLRVIQAKSNVKRQYFYPLKLEGLSYVYPIESDWDQPVKEYFSSAQFQLDKHRIVTKYLGNEVSELIDRISNSADIGPYEEIILLTEEKELQAKELLDAALREQKRQRITNWLIAGVIIVILLLLLIYLRYYFKSKANQALAEKQILIEQRNEQLIELNQEKNNLIRVVAHDLRNPVNQVLGFSRLLLEDTNNFTAEQVQMITFMMQSSERLRGMISKILDVDAIETGGHNVKIESVNVQDVLAHIVLNFNERAQDKGILLVVQSNADVSVQADKVYLTQVLENLVSNALKFSSKNTTIHVAIQEETTTATFVVADEGPGFTEDDKKRIFKKYQQLSAVSTAGEPSTGLGLSIVKMFTELMNGIVTYKTEKGRGTSFFVTLPKG